MTMLYTKSLSVAVKPGVIIPPVGARVRIVREFCHSPHSLHISTLGCTGVVLSYEYRNTEKCLHWYNVQIVIRLDRHGLLSTWTGSPDDFEIIS